MFDDINRKIHNQFYLNIEFVGGQICCVVFAKSAQSQTCIWTNLKCISIFILLSTSFMYFDFFLIIEGRCPGVKNHTDVSSAIFNARDFVGIAGHCTSHALSM